MGPPYLFLRCCYYFPSPLSLSKRRFKYPSVFLQRKQLGIGFVYKTFFIIECLITASRHTTVSNRALVQQPATLPHNATTVVRPLFTNSSHQTHEKGVAFTIPQLAPGNHYTGPSGNDLCQCNTVIYSLISACAGCQNGTWMSCVRFFFILLHCP